MFLNEAFMQVFEELGSLTEAKADTQRLIDFAGEDLANRFLAVKDRLKSPENDLYYWIKNKTVEELEAAVLEIENTKSKSQMKKDIADQGAELVCDSEHWTVHRIITFEASQKYGRDSLQTISAETTDIPMQLTPSAHKSGRNITIMLRGYCISLQTTRIFP